MAEYVAIGPWVNGGAPALSAANLDTLETQYFLIKSEDLTFAGVKSFSGTILVAADIQHIGDTNTKIAFAADAISLETGGTSRIDLSNTGVRLGAANARVTTILDEDAMGSDSATALATQQSIKAYVDARAKIASGTYTGNDADDRQIATGFVVKAAIIHLPGAAAPYTWIVSASTTNSMRMQSGADPAVATDALPHAADGFVVDQIYANQNTEVYYYVAFG